MTTHSEDGKAKPATPEKVLALSKPPGCVWKPALMGVAGLAAGVYLMGRWEGVNGAGRAGSVMLVVVGTLLLLPFVGYGLLLAVKWYIGRKLGKSLGGLMGSAKEMVERNKAIFADEYQHRPATEADFAQLDRAWYDAATAELTRLGYRHLGDVVNETIAKATGTLTVLRAFASADGTTAAAVYHVVLAKMPSAFAGQVLKMVDLDTELPDGTFMTTGNSGDSDLTTPPPGINRDKRPLGTPIAELVAAHEATKSRWLADHTDRTLPTVESLADLLASQARQHKIKVSHRKGIGYLDPEEVRRVAERSDNIDPATVEAVTAAADVARRAEQTRES